MAEDDDVGGRALVLVHGGGHDARCWERVEAAITGRSDVRTLAVDLPGRGSQPGPLKGLTVAAYVEAVAAQIRGAGLDRIVLVGHSMAGMIVPGVVDALPDGAVDRVVLIAANVAPPGRSVLDTLPLPTRITGRLLARWPRPYRMPKPMARALFCNGMTPEQTQFVLDRLVPEAGWLAVQPILAPRRQVPTGWVLTQRDRAVSPALQRQAIAALEARGADLSVVEIDAPHDVMASHPDQLAEILVRTVVDPKWR